MTETDHMAQIKGGIVHEHNEVQQAWWHMLALWPAKVGQDHQTRACFDQRADLLVNEDAVSH